MKRLQLASPAFVFVLCAFLSAQPLNLDQCIQMALATHPLVQTSVYQRQQASARRRQAEAQLRPEINLSATGRLQGPVVTFAIPFPGAPPRKVTVLPSTSHLMNLELRQNVYSGGRFGHAIRGARHYEEAAEEAIKAARQQIILQVTEAYANYLSAKAMEEVSRQSVERVRLILRMAKARLEAGVAPRFDVFRAEAELAAAEESLLQSQNAVALAQSTLNELIGRSTREPLQLASLPDLPDVPLDRWDDPRLIENALAFRPELAALDRQVEAREERVRFARADDRPLVFLSSNYQRQTTTGFAKGFQWGVSFFFQLPMFDSGRRRSVIEEEEAALQQTLAQREQMKKTIRLEVEQAIRLVQLGYQRLKTAQSALASAEEAFRLAQTRYDAGVGTLVEVWDAQVALTRARAALVQSFYETHKAIARLSFATAIPVGDLLALVGARQEKQNKAEGG